MLLTGFFLSVSGQPQIVPAPDQNPSFTVSRDKYMKIADSLNSWHSTTLQENYKAIDWLADRKEARADREQFRRQLRMRRVSWYGDDYYNSYRIRNGFGYNRGYYNNPFYNRSSLYLTPRGYRPWWW